MKTELPRIRAVEAVGPSTIAVTWDNHPRESVDLSGWIATGGDIIALLRDPAVFGTPRVSDYGAAVGWGDPDGDLAIDAEHLRRIAEAQRPFGQSQLVAWQEEIGFSNQEAASFLGVSLSTWNAYKAGSPIPVHIGMVCRAATRDPILVHAHYRPRVAGRPRKAVRLD